MSTHHHTPRRRLGALATTGVVAALLLTGCGTVDLDQALEGGPSDQRAVAEDAAAGGHTALDPVHVPAGQSQTVTVPENVVSAHVVLKGASGSPSHRNEARGVIIEGDLAVAPGDQLVIAAGGAGGDNDGSKSPGGGGWSLPGFEGGRGGGGRGSQAQDGSGGGGASVLLHNGQPVVVAGAGGGAGGPTTPAGLWTAGGDAGPDNGESGSPAFTGYQARGGSVADSSLDKTGGSANADRVMGGGGGGGGGWHAGEGGRASGGGGGGGGGGDSLYRVLSNVRIDSRCQDYHTCGDDAKGGNQGNGDARLSWTVAPDSERQLRLTKTGAPGSPRLEAVSGSTEPGSGVQVAAPSDDDGARDQTWVYRFHGAQGAGTLVNRASGLCLEVNGTTGKIDQWTCDPSGPNQLWRMQTRPNGDTVLAVDLDRSIAGMNAETYYLGTKTHASDVADGTGLDLVSDPDNDMAAWSVADQ